MSNARKTSKPKYSICSTNFNTIGTLEQSLLSILNQISSEFEVIIVDNCSNDGSSEVLREYAERGLLRLIVRKCTRGLGRQIGFENSQGEYVIAHMDLDIIFKPTLKKLLDIYHENFEGLVLTAPGFLIAPRHLLAKLDGWRDLQRAETREIWMRAAKIGVLRFLPYNLIVRTHSPDPRRTMLRSRIREVFDECRDLYRIGITPRRLPAESYTFYIIRFIAWLTYRFKPCYGDPFNRTFKIEKYAVQIARSDMLSLLTTSSKKIRAEDLVSGM